MSVKRRNARNFCYDCRGATALEFAILSPVFLMVTVGLVNLALLLYTAGSLQFAVEDAARCASVKTTICTSTSTIQVYASGKYFGPTVTPTFTATSPSCGHSVSATATYVMNIGVARYSVPLSAVACYP